MMRAAHLAMVVASAAAAAYEPVAARRIAQLHLRTSEVQGVTVAGVALSPGGEQVATAQYKNDLNVTGWGYLNITSSAAFSDEQMAFAAGYLEGQLTWESIHYFTINSGSNFSWPEKTSAFLEANEEFMRSSIAANLSDPYWHQMSLLRQQLEGLYYGYVDGAAKGGIAPSDVFPFRALMNIQLSGDFEDINAAVGLQADPHLEVLPPHPRDVARGIARRPRTVRADGFIDGNAGHCSALVKLLPGNAELFISQVTWSAFETMMRIYKSYTLPYSLTGDKASGTLAAATVTFSSYPGSCGYSGDDWYQMSSGLVMLETTIGNSNATLYKLYVRPTTVLEWMRNIVANRMATDGASWVAVYSQWNSGTYNNENVILDYNKFTPGQPLPDGVLTVADQIPGYIVSDDLTYYLRDQGYFPSYNSPVFPLVFNLSGDEQAFQQGGIWFSYNLTARAQIFARNQSMVVDEESFKALMRYNDFPHDPLASIGCGTNPPTSGENAVAARDDLNPADGTYPIGALGQRDHAGIDAKGTSFSLMMGRVSPFTGVATPPLSTFAQNGPTYDQLPPFVFSTSPYANSTSHVAMPDAWQFPWVTITWPLV